MQDLGPGRRGSGRTEAETESGGWGTVCRDVSPGPQANSGLQIPAEEQAAADRHPSPEPRPVRTSHEEGLKPVPCTRRQHPPGSALGPSWSSLSSVKSASLASVPVASGLRSASEREITARCHSGHCQGIWAARGALFRGTAHWENIFCSVASLLQGTQHMNYTFRVFKCEV